jgi:hypothetical protein
MPLVYYRFIFVIGILFAACDRFQSNQDYQIYDQNHMGVNNDFQKSQIANMIAQQLIKQIDSYDSKAEANAHFIRDKKSRDKSASGYNNDEKVKENEPLLSHRRKNFFNNGVGYGDERLLEQNAASIDNKQTCLSTTITQSNMIIDTRTSLKNGAHFLGYDFITPSTATATINGLQQNCMLKCCEEDGCDTALLSMILSEVLKQDIIFTFKLSIYNQIKCTIDYFNCHSYKRKT